MFAIRTASDQNQLVPGGQLYWALPFSKDKPWAEFSTLDVGVIVYAM